MPLRHIQRSQLAYWHISTLKFNFGNTDAVIVQHDAEVAGGSAFERIGNQLAIFADGARIYGEELSPPPNGKSCSGKTVSAPSTNT